MPKETFIEENLQFYTKYKKSLDELTVLKGQKQFIDKEVTVLWGASGGGKTHKVYEDNEIGSVYKAMYGNSGLWFDGYDPKVHQVLLLDEFVGQVKFQDLLCILDKYPYNVEVKGGVLPLLVKKVYICSNKDPVLWYDKYKGTEFEKALFRRIRNIIYFEKPFQGSII